MSALKVIDRQRRGVYVSELVSELHDAVRQIAAAQSSIARIAGMLPYATSVALRADAMARPLPDAAPVPSDGLMNAKRAASYLGIAERTLYDWCEQRGCPFELVAGRRRWRRIAIDAWIQEQQG